MRALLAFDFGLSGYSNSSSNKGDTTMNRLGKLAIVLTCLIGGLQGTSAQAQGVDIFTGYTYERDTFGNNVGLNGYNVAGVWNVSRKVGIEANLAGHHGTTITSSTVTGTPSSDTKSTQTNDNFTFVFGPKLNHSIGPENDFQAFTHFLVGGTRMHQASTFTIGSTTSPSGSMRGTGFAMMLGGGLDWYRGHWGARILELDFVRSNVYANSPCGATCTNSFNTSASNFRVAAGLIWRSESGK
jgi:hypothetical protein